MRKVVILGATGSIGRQTLEVVEAFPERFAVVGLSVHRQIAELPALINRYRPRWVAVTDAEAYQAFVQQNGTSTRVRILSQEALYQELMHSEAEVVLNAMVGAAGFWASWHTLLGSAYLALANKESLVFGGPWLQAHRHRILPVDSEHSALFQCLTGESEKSVARLILTASGGPFRGRETEDLRRVSVQDALRHPTWRMGHRITIDSATLMNKALELIEAHWLFGVPHDSIEVWVHPECVVHSLVEFIDGSMKAQLSLPDMRLPILYALSYPERLSWEVAPYRLSQPLPLHFEPVDEETFPSLKMARAALEKGPAAPALLNAADEVAVEHFLQGHIRFLDIFACVAWALEQPEMNQSCNSPKDLAILEADFRRKVADMYISSCKARVDL